MERMASMLQLYGGWGVATVCMFAMVWMARHIVGLNRELREDSKHTVAALVEVKHTMQASAETLQKIFERMLER